MINRLNIIECLNIADYDHEHNVCLNIAAY